MGEGFARIFCDLQGGDDDRPAPARDNNVARCEIDRKEEHILDIIDYKMKDLKNVKPRKKMRGFKRS